MLSKEEILEKHTTPFWYDSQDKSEIYAAMEEYKSQSKDVSESPSPTKEEILSRNNIIVQLREMGLLDLVKWSMEEYTDKLNQENQRLKDNYDHCEAEYECLQKEIERQQKEIDAIRNDNGAITLKQAEAVYDAGFNIGHDIGNKGWSKEPNKIQYFENQFNHEIEAKI